MNCRLPAALLPQVPGAVLRGGGADVLFEQAREIVVVLVPDLQSDLGEREIGVDQKLLRFPHPFPDHEIHDGLPCFAFEHVIAVGDREMELLRDALERNLFGVVLQKMVLDLERQRVLVRVGDGVPACQEKRAEKIPDLIEGAVGCKKTVAGVEQSPDLRRRRVGRDGRDRL